MGGGRQQWVGHHQQQQSQALSFEFRGGAAAAADAVMSGAQEPYLGVAAPYDPLRDRVERKKPGPRRGASSRR